MGPPFPPYLGGRGGLSGASLGGQLGGVPQQLAAAGAAGLLAPGLRKHAPRAHDHPMMDQEGGVKPPSTIIIEASCLQGLAMAVPAGAGRLPCRTCSRPLLSSRWTTAPLPRIMVACCLGGQGTPGQGVGGTGAARRAPQRAACSCVRMRGAAGRARWCVGGAARAAAGSSTGGALR